MKKWMPKLYHPMTATNQAKIGTKVAGTQSSVKISQTHVTMQPEITKALDNWSLDIESSRVISY